VENKAPPQGAIRLFRQNTKRHARSQLSINWRFARSIGARRAFNQFPSAFYQL
jgi:hypothetical protein